MARRFVLRIVHGLFVAAPRHAAALADPSALAALLSHSRGGPFAAVDPPALTRDDLALIARAAAEDWSAVDLPIFGALFEASLDRAERHALGAHYTHESDILKIVAPTIERPWSARITAAAASDLPRLHAELSTFKILDPACGSGNFLYYAYRALLRLEALLAARLPAAGPSRIRLDQLHGIDIDPLAVEISVITLILARARLLGPHTPDTTTPQLLRADALRAPWPPADAIIGNPPFLDARKFAAQTAPADLQALRDRYPGVPRRADLCVYWFRRAHDHLAPGQRAGLVGTNTIRQNYSREGGLDHIIDNDGTITDAVATQVWSGDAAVHVSIVNWIRGDAPGPHTLATQLGDSPASPWRHESLPRIPASLRAGVDVAGARPLAACAAPFCHEGVQPGHHGFRLSAAEARPHLPGARDVLSPYITGGALLSGEYQRSPEYLIDLPATLAEAAHHPDLLAHLERTVLPDWRRDAAAERARTGKPTGEHQNRLTTWWQIKRPRPELQGALRRLSRYIACARVTRRPIFAFLDPTFKPDSSLTVFAAEDDYSFGLLQSSLHWAWFQARCSTLKRDHRYTSNTVFDSFPWPQSPSLSDITAVAAAAAALRTTRTILIINNHHSRYHNLREVYRAAEAGECDQLLIMQQALDHAVRAAYGMPPDADPLAFLLALNHELAARESRGQPITAPGLPPAIDPRPFITDDRITP